MLRKLRLAVAIFVAQLRCLLGRLLLFPQINLAKTTTAFCNEREQPKFSQHARFLRAPLLLEETRNEAGVYVGLAMGGPEDQKFRTSDERVDALPCQTVGVPVPAGVDL